MVIKKEKKMSSIQTQLKLKLDKQRKSNEIVCVKPKKQPRKPRTERLPKVIPELPKQLVENSKHLTEDECRCVRALASNMDEYNDEKFNHIKEFLISLLTVYNTPELKEQLAQETLDDDSDAEAERTGLSLEYDDAEDEEDDYFEGDEGDEDEFQDFLVDDDTVEYEKGFDPDSLKKKKDEKKKQKDNKKRKRLSKIEENDDEEEDDDDDLEKELAELGPPPYAD